MKNYMPGRTVSTLLIAGLSSIVFLYCAYCQPAQYDAKGKRDPLVPLVGFVGSKVIGAEDIASIEDVRLEGIAIGAGGKKAVIMNGKILKENDNLGKLAVKKITNLYVTFSISGKDYILNLPKDGGQKSEKKDKI